MDITRGAPTEVSAGRVSLLLFSEAGQVIAPMLRDHCKDIFLGTTVQYNAL